MITLRPTGGLGNRMLAIHSALHLCHQWKKDCHILWVKNQYLNASFFDLFEPIDVGSFQLTFEETSKPSLLYSDRELPQLKQRIYNALLKRYQRVYFDQVIHGYEVAKRLTNGYSFQELEHVGKILITSWSRFAGTPLKPGVFVPVGEVSGKINGLTEQFSAHTVGIHIRRGDHIESTRLSPTSLFMEKMDALIETNAQVRFFLSSDSDEEKGKLIQRYGDRIIQQTPEKGDRNSTHGMQSAVVDMFGLAATDKILGSSLSTFSLVASELGEIPFEEVRR